MMTEVATNTTPTTVPCCPSFHVVTPLMDVVIKLWATDMRRTTTLILRCFPDHVEFLKFHVSSVSSIHEHPISFHLHSPYLDGVERVAGENQRYTCCNSRHKVLRRLARHSSPVVAARKHSNYQITSPQYSAYHCRWQCGAAALQNRINRAESSITGAQEEELANDGGRMQLKRGKSSSKL